VKTTQLYKNIYQEAQSAFVHWTCVVSIACEKHTSTI